MKILDSTKKSKLSGREENVIGIELRQDTKVFSPLDVSQTVDEYEQYVEEKDSSNQYRLLFTIRPYCSNVLYNQVTECVYEEGSDDCIFFGNGGPTSSLPTSIRKYNSFKGTPDSDVRFSFD